MTADAFIDYLILSVIFLGGLVAIAYLHVSTRDIRRARRGSDQTHPAE